MTHGIALAGRFDLDDLSPHVAEQLPAERSGNQCTELQDTQIGKSAGWCGSGSVMAARLYHNTRQLLQVTQ